MSTMKTRSLTAAGAALVAAAGFALPGVAGADPHCDHWSECGPKVQKFGTFNGGGKTFLKVYARPSEQSKVLRRVRTGTRALIICQTLGRSVSGPYGTGRVWDGLRLGGYISDTRVFTGSDSAIIKSC